MREREIRAHETTVNVMQTFELGMKQGHWLKSFNRWEISALSPHHLESQPSQFSQDWRDSRITFTAKTKTLPGKQGQVDYPTTILLFLISSSKTVAYLTSCFKVALATLWLSFFFFFCQFPMLVSGSQITYIKHLVSPCIYCHQWKHLQLYESGKCWMRYVIIMMHRK